MKTSYKIASGILLGLATGGALWKGATRLQENIRAEAQGPNNPFYDTALFNRSAKTGVAPYRIIDEDRDGQADMIVGEPHGITDPIFVEWIREGHKIKTPIYIVTSNTRTMPYGLFLTANAELEAERDLNQAIDNSNRAESK